MNFKNVENSDLLALLGGQTSEGANGLASGESSEFLSMMKDLGLGVDLEGLSREGLGLDVVSKMSDAQLDSLVELASEDGVVNLKDVQKVLSENGELEASTLKKSGNDDLLNSLLAKDKQPVLEKPMTLEQKVAEAKSQFPQSENSILSKLKGQSAGDFVDMKNIKNIKMQNGKQVLVSSQEGMNAEIPQMKSLPQNQGLNQYTKNHQTMSSNIIQFPNGEIEGNVTKSETIQKGDSIQSQNSSNITLQDILTQNSDGQGFEGSADGNESKFEGPVKTVKIDLSNIKSSNKEALINRISNYIEQNNIQNQKQLDVIVHHDELGQMEISAKKVGARGNQVALEIQSATEQGHKFFVDNEAELVKSLNKSGIKLADVKLSMSTEMSFASSDSGAKNQSQNSERNNSQNNFFQNNSSSSERNERDGGSQRRKELWNTYKENLEQASA